MAGLLKPPIALTRVAPCLPSTTAPPLLTRGPRRYRIALRATGDVRPDAEDLIKCYMTAEGHLVCDRLDPGNYRVEAVDTPEDSPAHCDVNNPRDCFTYCYILDDGTMVCEGLPAGEYAIKQAGEKEIDGMLEHLQTLQNRQSLEVGSEPGPVEKAIGTIVEKARST